MAHADSGMGSHREGRQERRQAPRQPGATGTEPDPASPEQAEKEARNSFGKTGQHTSGEE
jgi:hypothetical protein